MHLIFLIHFYLLYSTETWSIMFVTLTQDVPYLIIRIIIMNKCGSNVSGSISFFMLKNVLMIMFGISKVKKLFLEFKEFYAKLEKEQSLKNPVDSLSLSKMNTPENLISTEIISS